MIAVMAELHIRSEIGTIETCVGRFASCGGQKVDQPPVLRSSNPSIVVVQTPKDWISDDA
jgi:hypothetical protein